jgi:hypothetical protein
MRGRYALAFFPFLSCPEKHDHVIFAAVHRRLNRIEGSVDCVNDQELAGVAVVARASVYDFDLYIL